MVNKQKYDKVNVAYLRGHTGETIDVAADIFIVLLLGLLSLP